MTTPKQQHIIPCLHLRHFANRDSRVWNYDAVNARVWSTTPDKTATEGHFYSGELRDGTIDTSIETHLSLIESTAAPTYAGLLGGQIPSPGTQARTDFAHLLGLMYSRTRAMRRVTAELRGRDYQILLYATAQDPCAFDVAVKKYEGEIGRALTKTEREGARQGMLDPSQYEWEIPKAMTLRVLGLADELATLLARMHWALLRPAAGFFITSDNPLTRQVHRSTVHPIYGDNGFENQSAEVMFPLSPSLMLLLVWHSRRLESATLPIEFVARANEVRAAQSEQYLYADRKDPDIEALARRYRDSRPTLTTEGLGPQKFGRITVGKT